MLIHRGTLNRILGLELTHGRAEAEPDAAAAVFGRARVKTIVSPWELSALKLAVDGVQNSPLILEQRTVSVVPETLMELRQHPVVRVAYLESMLYDMAQGMAVSPEQFKAQLLAEGIGGTKKSMFSFKDKLAIVKYLQEVTIPKCYGQVQEESSLNLSQVATILDDIGNGLETADVIRSLPDSDSDFDFCSDCDSDSDSDSDYVFVSASEDFSLEHEDLTTVEFAQAMRLKAGAPTDVRKKNQVETDEKAFDVAAAFKKTDIPKADQNIFLAAIKTITKRIMEQLQALYRAMGGTGVRLTAEECALLVNAGVVDEKALNDLPRAAMDELRKLLPVLKDSQRMGDQSSPVHSLSSQDHIEPHLGGDTRMRARGLQPAGSGLFNYGNNCFMNSTLQAVADSWQECGILDGVRQDTSPYALFNMFDSIDQSHATGVGREQKIRRLVRRVQQNPDAIYDADMPPKSVDAFKAYRDLRSSFLALCDGLNGRSGDASTLVREQKAFFEAYGKYSDIRNKRDVREILNSTPGEKVVFSRIPQQDPQEFFTTITEALGIDRDPEYGIGSNDRMTLLKDGRKIDVKTQPGHYTMPQVAIPLVGSTLQESVKGYNAEELLERDEQIRWDLERLQQLGVAQDERTTTTKEIIMSAKAPPRQLTMQMKLFSNYDDTGKFIHSARYMKEEGQQILRKINRLVKVPMVLQQTATQAAQEVVVPYEIKSIVCHRGSSLNSGHYVTLKFKDGQVIVCDDDIVADIETYAQYHGREPYIFWEDFCKREKLTPYLILTKRMDK